MKEVTIQEILNNAIHDQDEAFGEAIQNLQFKQMRLVNTENGSYDYAIEMLDGQLVLLSRTIEEYPLDDMRTYITDKYYTGPSVDICVTELLNKDYSNERSFVKQLIA